MKLNLDKKIDLIRSKNKRIEFNKSVIEVLFRSANGRCSVPRCKKPTMGPDKSGLRALNMGVACHIFSAAATGPRGRSGQDDRFISSVENGIWCCQYHAALIDKNNGSDYSAAMLFAWKKLAEARTLKLMNDVPSPLGWVESIEFTEFAEKTKLPKVNLSRNTLVKGRNGSGKSVLLEIAATISNGNFSERFLGTTVRNVDGTSRSAEFCAKVKYSTVDSFEKEITVEIRDSVFTRKEGSVECLLPPGDIEVVLVSKDQCQRQSDEDDIEFFVRVLGIDKIALYSLAKIGTKSVMPGDITFVQAIVYDDEDNAFPREKENGAPYMELCFKKKGKSSANTFSGLSGSEQVRLILDLFISKAREVCKQRLTLLLIDDFISNFDEVNFENLLTELCREDFQSVAIFIPGHYKKFLEQDKEKSSLKKLDFLEAWRLVDLDALGYFSD